MPEIVLASEFAVSRTPQLVNTRLLNFMTERQPEEAEGKMPLIGCPGTLSLKSVGLGPHRGSWNFNGVIYTVSGSELWSVAKNGAGTLVGIGISGTNRVSMSDNGVQLCIVNGVAGWIYTVAGGLVSITSAAFYPANTVSFTDGYFIFDRVGTNQWFLSDLYDGLTYNGLDFASAEGQPGFVTATVQNLQLEFIFCSSHIEIWYDAGTANFPFQRYSGGIINYGCISPYSIIKQDGAIFFLGADHVFYRLQANAALRVSTHPIETLLAKADNITNVFCMTFTWEGHKLVFMTVPSLNKTLCYDISTGKWHERNSVDADYIDLGAWRFSTAVAAYDGVYLGDSLSGEMGIVDSDIFTEIGNPMIGLIWSMNQHADRRRIFCSRLELQVQAGVGLTTGQGSDPQIMMRRSIDGGMTWSKTQLWRSMGMEGEYLKRLRWMAQGQGRQMMWEFVVTDPVRRTIIAAYADIKAGMG